MLRVKCYNYKYNDALVFFINNTEIGRSSISACSQKRGIINHIIVHEKYRSMGFGSYILFHSEHYLIKKYCISNINVLAWQPHGGHVSKFYVKNNYRLSTYSNIDTYDDGENIFDIIPLQKSVQK